MKIKEINLENFRGFNNLTLHVNGKNVVLVGTNGAGKSTILNAAIILLSRVVEALTNGESKKINLTEADIKNGQQNLKIKLTLTYNGFEREIEIAKSRAEYPKSKSKLTVKDNTKEIIARIKQKMDEKGEFNAPVFVNYPVHRNVLDLPFNSKIRHEFDQFSAYQNCFSSGVDFKFFFEWYRNQEDLENEQKVAAGLDYQDKQLKAVRQAVYNFMPGFSELKIMRKGKMRMVIKKGQHALEVNQLSNGEKCTLAMIGDLARRLALANPSLENPLEGIGIVFIDEIELHLHPAWQREIVNRLQSTFPNIQFILSTHSPQVLGEIRSAQIFFVTENEMGEDIRVHRVPTLFGKDSNMILEQFMGAAEKNEEIKEQQHQLFKLIMDCKYIEAKKLLDKLVGILGSDDPRLIKADLILKRKESLDL